MRTLTAVLLLLPAGCGTQTTVGPTTVTARIRDLCGSGVNDEDLMRSTLIGIDALRADGVLNTEALIAVTQSCDQNETEVERLNCFNCFTHMVDHVYTH